MRRSVLVGLPVLFLALFAQEWAVRFALPEFDPARQVRFHASAGDQPTLAEPGASFRQVKNTGDFNVSVRINQRGFRDPADVAMAQADDWVVAGDSFGFGWGVEVPDRFSERLAPIIGHRVFNISIPGGLRSVDRLLRYAAGLGGNVRQVVLQVTMERDVSRYDDASPAPFVPEERISVSSSSIQGVKEWLTENSTLYFLVTTLIHQSGPLKEVAADLGLLRRNLDAIHHEHFDSAAVTATVERIEHVLRPYDRSVVLIVPARALWVGTPEARAEADKTHRAVIASLQARQVTVVDMRAAFEAGGSPLDYHFLNDGHWNPRGHALAAQLLAKTLEAMGAGG